MYHEEVEKWTRDELLSHLKTMLLDEQANHADTLLLAMPKSVDTSSVIGGVMRAARDTLPQYAIDVTSKVATQTPGIDENTFTYYGAITILVGADRAPVVDALIKRHATVIQRWINGHLHPFPNGDEVNTNYWIMEMLFSQAIFSGAMPMENSNQDSSPSYWVAGVEIGLQWTLAESAPMTLDHV